MSLDSLLTGTRTGLFLTAACVFGSGAGFGTGVAVVRLKYKHPPDNRVFVETIDENEGNPETLTFEGETKIEAEEKYYEWLSSK